MAWLNRSGIIFAGQDKWSLDPRVELQQLSALEYSLRIQKVDVYDEGSYTCSVQTLHHPKTSQVYLIVQGKTFDCLREGMVPGSGGGGADWELVSPILLGSTTAGTSILAAKDALQPS